MKTPNRAAVARELLVRRTKTFSFYYNTFCRFVKKKVADKKALKKQNRQNIGKIYQGVQELLLIKKKSVKNTRKFYKKTKILLTNQRRNGIIFINIGIFMPEDRFCTYFGRKI